MSRKLEKLQQATCQRFGATPLACPANLKVGISWNVRDGELPVHGVRMAPEGDTTGWYIWAGEYSDSADFFVPLCVEHLEEWQPLVLPYLQLPTGWRFLLAPDHEDVWCDEGAGEDA